jgi:hypothetical protein
VGQPLDGGPAGIPEAEEVGDLIKRFARGVVQCLSQESVLSPRGHVEQHRVATAYQKTDEGGRQFTILEGGSEEMTFEMIHPDQGTIETKGQGLPVHHANEQRSNKARPGRDGNSLDVFQLDSGLSQRLFDHGTHRLHMGAAGQLGHDAPKDFVNILG